MLRSTEVAGFVGAALAGAAYVPQIWHLIAERCSAGISRLAFATWFAASALVTTHAVVSGATVFVVLGVIQLGATALILLCATKYASSYCASHAPPPRGLASSDHRASATGNGTGSRREVTQLRSQLPSARPPHPPAA